MLKNIKEELKNKKTVTIKVKIIPGSSQNQIVGTLGEYIKIKIKAQPEKGKANKELINFLSKELNIPKQNITIKKGHTTPLKTIIIHV